MLNSNVLLHIQNLTLGFATKEGFKVILKDIDISVKRKKTLCIVGESGCGKSVLANSILGLLPGKQTKITAGNILFSQKNLAEMSNCELRKIRGKKISMVFQNPMSSFNPCYSIGNQLVEMYLAHFRGSKKDAYHHCCNVLASVGFSFPEKKMRQYPHEMSGGMRQRVMIAMAILCNPELIIADEPTTALDVTTQKKILNLFKRIVMLHDTAILLITHDFGIVSEIADEVIVMYFGEIVEYASIDNIFKTPSHPYTRGLLNSLPSLNRGLQYLPTMEGLVPDYAKDFKGCGFYERCEYAKVRCSKEKPQLITCGDKKIRCWRYCGDE